MVITSEFDPLRDEGTEYALKLKNAGVNVWYKCFPGQLHCLIGLPSGSPEYMEYEVLVKNAMKLSGLQKFSKRLEQNKVKHFSEEYLGGHGSNFTGSEGRISAELLPFFDAFLQFSHQRYNCLPLIQSSRIIIKLN